MTTVVQRQCSGGGKLGAGQRSRTWILIRMILVAPPSGAAGSAMAGFFCGPPLPRFRLGAQRRATYENKKGKKSLSPCPNASKHDDHAPGNRDCGDRPVPWRRHQPTAAAVGRRQYPPVERGSQRLALFISLVFVAPTRPHFWPLTVGPLFKAIGNPQDRASVWVFGGRGLCGWRGLAGPPARLRHRRVPINIVEPSPLSAVLQGTVPEYPIPFEFWCAKPDAAMAGTDSRNLTGSNGQACFW